MLEPTPYSSEKLIERIFQGSISMMVLPDDLFIYHYVNIFASVGKGFGLPTDLDGIRFDTATKFKRNIAEFAGSKSFIQTATLTDAMFTPDGKRVSFAEFKKVTEGVNMDFNKNWLKTEMNTSYGIAQNAEKWAQIEEDADIFPLLQYVTVGDGRVRPEHASWDKIIKPVDDPFWDGKYPQNDWNCRCEVRQLRTGTISKTNGQANTAKAFNNNPYKSGQVFTKDHDYFNVPDEFKNAQSKNFGFETPPDSRVKEHIKKIGDGDN